ncbi:MAG: GntR family transcriptional regulator [Anaerolineae bacterium]
MIDLKPLNEQIERELRNGIVNGQLKPGQKISIEELANEWHVSSTPVRDAVRRLESAGFVKVAPRKSVYVAVLDARAFRDVFDLRIALECLAVALALPNLSDSAIQDVIQAYEDAFANYSSTGDLAAVRSVDNLLHELFIQHSGNAKLIQIMEELADLITWARNIIVREVKSYDAAHPEHMAILTAARARDSAAAQGAMRTHLHNSYLRTIARWDQLADAG